jgi:DNA-binding GntR family transcriptional regulator
MEMKSVPASLRKQVYERIKRDIVTGKLAAGELLNESQLARRFEMSKTPIREALSQLQQDYLIEPIPRKGYLVTNLTFRDIQEVFEARLILERAVTVLAADRITDAEISRLERYLEADGKPEDATNLYHYIRANTEFHLEIAAASRNSRLARLLAQVFVDAERLQYMDLHRSEERRATWYSGHKKLVEALRKRDKEAAANTVEDELAALFAYVTSGSRVAGRALEREQAA